jgi:hypothetical protein
MLIARRPHLVVAITKTVPSHQLIASLMTKLYNKTVRTARTMRMRMGLNLPLLKYCPLSFPTFGPLKSH